MNTKRGDRITKNNDVFIASDTDAIEVLRAELPSGNISKILLDVALKAAENYSFVSHQTYPRPSHPMERKRLDPLFTFTAVITSLRCTLQTEQRVTDIIIEKTNGDPKVLASMQPNTLQEILRPAGMASQKSRWIYEGLSILSTQQDYSVYNLIHNPIEDTREKLLLLNGMGEKAVDCYMLSGLELPVFPVDVNVFRVVSGIFHDQLLDQVDKPMSFSNKKHVRSVKDLLETNFPKNTRLYKVLHTYLLLAGKNKIAP